MDKGYEEAWQAELLKRMAEVESGSVKTAPWAEVRQRLARRLK